MTTSSGPDQTVLVLVTGGTVTMAGGAHGLAVSDDGLGVVRAVIDDWERAHDCRAEVVLDTPLRDSASMGPADWSRWSQQIRTALPRVTGVVVLHGTDTMAYTGAALSYALADASVPVVLTGAQRGPVEPGSDAAGNVRLALDTAIGGSAGVSLAFAGKVLAAATIWKRSTTDLDGFAGVPGTSRRRASLPQGSQPGGATTALAGSGFVALASVTLGTWHDQLTWPYEPAGVVLRVFGGGTAPRDPEAEQRLAALRDAEIPVVAVSQVPGAHVDVERYEAGHALRDGGVITCGAMTAEAAYAKLHHLLARGLPYDALCRTLATDLVGESGADQLR